MAFPNNHKSHIHNIQNFKNIQKVHIAQIGVIMKIWEFGADTNQLSDLHLPQDGTS